LPPANEPTDMTDRPSDTATWVDDESTDAGPIEASAVGRGPVMLSSHSTGKNRRVLAFATVLLVAIGFLVVKGLGTASTYFRTADEAVAQVDTLGSRRFRVEGVVVEESVRTEKGSVVFLIESNAKQVEVRHQGDPPELFRPNLAVVLEGRFADGQASRPTGQAPIFLSDHLMVKHDESYIEKNRTRVGDYVGKTQS
jgi:cytochrome c-type biogenesis protein CcmE